MKILGFILLLLALCGVSFGLIQLIYWGICMCFGLDYVFIYGVGIWLIGLLFKEIFGDR